ncbi:LytTR family DNA-binding domain-containing protein [Sphingobacterium siyangense]|uniref:LytR/AlgR family response regulator transcription factor n=1 Tax=Sphingobacterium siyangense TaxID=459529 RepID=UPI00301A35A5
MTLRCYVIDDLPAIIRLINKFIEQTPLTSFVGGETDALKAKDLLLSGKIEADVVFLDIEMPGVSGIDLIEPLSRVANVILVSGHKDYGQQAFERGAVGYIFKPFDLETFQNTINRIYNNQRTEKSKSSGSPAPYYYIPMDGRGERYRLKAEDICYAETTKNFVVINTTDKKQHVCSLNLSQLAELLPQPHFIRISRSIIVSTSKIVSYNLSDVRLENGKEFAFGKQYKQDFIRIIREHGMLY